MTLLITGATGTVGREVFAALHASGHELRVATTNPAKATPHFGAQGLSASSVVRLEFGELTTYAAAFEGVGKMFLIRPPQLTDVKNGVVPALEVARRQGVEHVVFMSLQGTEKIRSCRTARLKPISKTQG